jgi:hypothetical protein
LPVYVHLNGLAVWLYVSMHASICSARSVSLVKMRCLSRRRYRIEKKISIWFSHDAWVGVN